MPLLGLIRHAPTTWNEAGMIQGHTDTPLSEDGRAQLATWAPPPELLSHEWVSSPLQRCVDTARHLAGRAVRTDPLLKEMSWGDWAGEKLPDLRKRFGEKMTAMEASGWDFRPPNGESPRDVGERFQQFSAKVAERGQPTVAVTHRGVIRAALALATGWDFLGKPPFKMVRAAVQVFWVNPDGSLELRAANVPLVEGADGK